MPQPDIQFTVDESSVIAALKQMQALERELEQGTEVAAESIRKTMTSAKEALISMGDRGSQALEKVTAGIMRRAQAYGLPEWQKIALQRDQMIQRFGAEESAIRKLTSAYEPLIAKAREAAEAAAKAESAGAGGSSFDTRRAMFGLGDIAEGRTRYAVVELVRTLGSLSGTAAIVGGVAAGVAGIGLAAYEAQKHMADLREEPPVWRRSGRAWVQAKSSRTKS